MVRLRPWQWGVLALPLVLIVGFFLVAAGFQIHAWRLNWIWAIFILMLVGWRWLLVQWTRPAFKQLESTLQEVSQELEDATAAATPTGSSAALQAESALEEILKNAQTDPPVWEDWSPFWQRCQEVVSAVALAYHPEVKYPLLNIYVPQVYGLIRGTVDDMDQWMDKLSPALGQVTMGQAVQAYEVYRKLEPSARKLWRVWNWAQWILNPAAATARTVSQPANNQATQQLLVNLNLLLREATLRNLYRQAIALYGGEVPPILELSSAKEAVPTAQTTTLRSILEKATPKEDVAQQPVNILLAGRTGAGKSSLLNTLFDADRAEVDVLPSTDQIRNYQWQAGSGETLILWDTPGYEQVDRADFREQVLDYAHKADVLLLVTPALDPALQMDADFLKDMKGEVEDLFAIAALTQVDRLRPIREWTPPYNWQQGTRPKEKAIREATQYRVDQFGAVCDKVIPIVTRETATARQPWNVNALALALVEAIDPAKQLRLTRFLRTQDIRTAAAARIIDRYTFQMTTTQGITALLKSPVLQFVSTLTTGSPALAYVLAEQIPVEQLPVVIGKLQIAYDLFNVIQPEERKLDLLALWPVLLEDNTPPDRAAWAFGHAILEYWSQSLSIDQLRERIDYYTAQYPGK